MPMEDTPIANRLDNILKVTEKVTYTEFLIAVRKFILVGLILV